MSKVMLVEDDDSLREIYSIRLTAEGYNIVSAKDGEEALAVAVRERPALIVSDVMMPKISGFDMLDILRSTPETHDIKVIMMTALSSEDERQRGERLGADRYLVKSQVGIEDVVNAVHEVLGDRAANGVINPAPAAQIGGAISGAVFNIPAAAGAGAGVTTVSDAAATANTATGAAEISSTAIAANAGMPTATGLGVSTAAVPAAETTVAPAPAAIATTALAPNASVDTMANESQVVTSSPSVTAMSTSTPTTTLPTPTAPTTLPASTAPAVPATSPTSAAPTGAVGAAVSTGPIETAVSTMPVATLAQTPAQDSAPTQEASVMQPAPAAAFDPTTFNIPQVPPAP